MKQEQMIITKQIQIAPSIYEMTLRGELVSQMNKAGQFLHIRVPKDNLLLRRPISIHEINREKRTCKIIYRVEGEGTASFSKLKKGDSLDVLGPLGNGFNTENFTKNQEVLIIGGGIGIPPLYELSKQLVSLGVKVTHLFGFSSKHVMYHLDKFQELGEVIVTTDDGSFGMKGFVSDKYEELCFPDAVFSCGNNGLLKSVDSHFHPHVNNVQLSFEARMACGIGACYACVCQKKKQPQKSFKVCDEGPIFQAGEVLI